MSPVDPFGMTDKLDDSEAGVFFGGRNDDGYVARRA
jgi:hypothetical protein